MKTYDKLQSDLDTCYPIADKGKALAELSKRGIKQRMQAGKSYITMGGKTIVGDIAAQWTGEKRPPKAGEFYLSGSIVEAYYSGGDMTYPYHIARLVIRQTVELERVLTVDGA